VSTLEFNSANQRRNAAQMGNISASNDPNQQIVDVNEQLIRGAEVIGAGDTLGLDRDTTLKLAQRKQKMDELRRQQRKARSERQSSSDARLLADDELIQDIDAQERAFQKESPQRAADPLELLQLGADEADLQQVRAGRIENIKQVDQAGGGEGGRERRRLQQQIRDRQPQRLNVLLEQRKGKPLRIVDEIPAGTPVPEDLREAVMLQELGLATPEKDTVGYSKIGKEGQRRRNFGNVVKDSDGEIVKERLSRVKRARPTGQLQNPNDIISTDKFLTAKRGSYRGIADDGPEEIRSPQMAPQRAGNNEYRRLVSAVTEGKVQLTDEVAPGKTVLDLLTRMEESQSGKAALELAKSEAAKTAIADMRLRKQNARKILRQVAIEADAVGDPLSPGEAQALLQRLETPEVDSRRKAEREAVDRIGSYGSTNEVIGESQMSDESWKAKKGRSISTPPVAAEPTIFARNLDIQREIAQPIMSGGEIIGYGAGGEILGNINAPTTDQVLNAPTPRQQDILDFIVQNMDEPDTGGVRDVVITDATRAFTDRVNRQRLGTFGNEQVVVPTGIRSLNEAIEVMDQLISQREGVGKTFSRYNPDGPTPLKVPKGERVTINDLMSTIKMDPVENKNLANALYQLALAETIDVNQAGKQRYAERRGSYQPVYRPEGASPSVNLELQRRGTPAVDLPRQNIIFDSPAGFFYDTVNPTFIRNQQKGPLGPEGKSVTIQPRLRELSDPDAAAPFIGMVAGEEPVGIAGDPNNPNYRYRKGFGQDVALEQGYTDLEKRMNRPFKQSAVDANIATAREVERRQAGGEEDAAVKRIMQQAESASFDDRMREQAQMDYQQDLRNQKIVKAKLGQQPQAVQPAPVPQSIAPDPWAETGSVAEPVVSTKSYRELTPELRAELNRINNPAIAESENRVQGPRMRTEPRTRQQRIDQIKNIGTKYRKPLTYGSLGAGAYAVLQGILGGGQDDELEVYQ
jgi:hypothetical protein